MYHLHNNTGVFMCSAETVFDKKLLESVDSMVEHMHGSFLGAEKWYNESVLGVNDTGPCMDRRRLADAYFR